MNTQQFLNLRQSLKENQSLQIDWEGKVKILGPRKKDFIFVGILESFDEAIVPLREKPWANVSTPGLKSFNKFGEPLPKYDRIHSPEYKIKIQIALGVFEGLKALGQKPKKSTWIDTIWKHSYNVEELGGIKVYLQNNIVRYVEFEGEKMIIPQLKPDLKEEKIVSIMGRCSNCKETYNIISMTEYFDRTNNKEFEFCFKCEDAAKDKNPNLIKKEK